MDALGQLEWDIDWHTHARRAHLLLLAGMWLFPKHSSSVTSSATSVDVELDALAASLNQLDFDIAEREQRLLQMEHVYINLRVNLDIYRRQTSTLGGHEWLPTLIKKGRARRETASAHALSDGVPKEQRVALMRKLIASFAAQLTERDEALELLQAEISDLEAEKSVLHEAIGNAIANATRASGTADATPTAAATASVTSANNVTSGANVTLQMMSAAAQSNVARADVASLVTEEKTLDIHLSVPPPGGRMGIALTDKNEIADLADGQLAQQCGLMVGDIIVAVDGVAIPRNATGDVPSAALYLSRTQDDPPHAQRRLVVIRPLVPSPPTPLADGMERQYESTLEEEEEQEEEEEGEGEVDWAAEMTMAADELKQAAMGAALRVEQRASEAASAVESSRALEAMARLAALRARAMEAKASMEGERARALQATATAAVEDVSALETRLAEEARLTKSAQSWAQHLERELIKAKEDAVQSLQALRADTERTAQQAAVQAVSLALSGMAKDRQAPRALEAQLEVAAGRAALEAVAGVLPKSAVPLGGSSHAQGQLAAAMMEVAKATRGPALDDDWDD